MVYFRNTLVVDLLRDRVIESEAVANSFWNSKQDAEAYSRTGYPEVLKTVSNVLYGMSTIETLEFY
jgi:hypothetical protein